MINIEGKTVLTELEELVDPAHTALIVIDMQRDFIEPDGLFGYARDRPLHVRRVEAALGSPAGRRPHVRHDRRAPAEHGAAGPNERLLRPRSGSISGCTRTLVATSRRCATPFPARRVTNSPRNSRRSRTSSWCANIGRAASGATNLDMLLRSNGIKTVVVGGCTTEGCVESTARDAMFNDFYVVIAEDCVASDDRAQHEASMLLMRHRFDMAVGEEIQRIWRMRGRPRARSTR